MRSFVAFIAYEVDPQAAPTAVKLLRAEMAGRRWKERFEGRLLPRGTLWMNRSASPEQTTNDLFRACAHDLRKAVAAVRASGRPIQVRRVWVQVTGGGTFGMVPEVMFQQDHAGDGTIEGSRPD